MFSKIVAPPVPPRTVPGNSSSSLVRHVHSKDEEQQDYKSKHGDASKDECPWMSVTKDEQSSPNRLVSTLLQPVLYKKSILQTSIVGIVSEETGAASVGN